MRRKLEIGKYMNIRKTGGKMGVCGGDMRRIAGKMAAAAASGILVLSVAGCGAGGQTPATAAVGAETAGAAGESGQADAGNDGAEGKTADPSKASQGTPGGKTGEYSASELDADWSQADSTQITCTGSQARIEGQGAAAEDGVITISAAGTYVLSGQFEGQLLVAAGKEDQVRLVLNGFQITNEHTSPIYGAQSGSILLILADGTENAVSDGADYVFDSADEDEPDAAVFSKDDLIINGQGTLRVTGNYSNGIRSKDGLKVISGTIEINAVKDGLKGKDFVLVKDGRLSITSGEDGIKSNNDKDEEKGYVVIDGGDIRISAGDDGIHAETWLTVNNGTIDIQKSCEGLEGMKVDINGGDIRIISSDDGINAAGGDSGSESGGSAERAKMQNNPQLYVRITGGTVRVDASADGIDSNGNLYVEGGEIYISGPEHSGDGALDYNGEAIISGGTFAAAGSAGMLQTFSQDSGQNMLMVYYDQTQEPGTALTLKDDSGKILLEYQPEKAYQCVLISLPGLEEGSTLQLENGSESQEITVSGTITTVGSAPAGRMGGGRQDEDGRGGRQGMGMPPGGTADGQERPSGGAERPYGGAERPSRGADAPSGGADALSGGADARSGGADAFSGDADARSGGAGTLSGGAEAPSDRPENGAGGASGEIGGDGEGRPSRGSSSRRGSRSADESQPQNTDESL